jgi:hypothetical protein
VNLLILRSPFAKRSCIFRRPTPLLIYRRKILRELRMILLEVSDWIGLC